MFDFAPLNRTPFFSLVGFFGEDGVAAQSAVAAQSSGTLANVRPKNACVPGVAATGYHLSTTNRFGEFRMASKFLLWLSAFALISSPAMAWDIPPDNGTMGKAAIDESLRETITRNRHV